MSNSGSGLMTLEAVGAVSPPGRNAGSGPGSRIDSTSAVNSGGEIQLLADSVQVDGQINSGAARTMFTPSTPSRAISLGGLDETGKLNLTQAELNNVTAGVIVVGGSAFSGGLAIESPITIAPANSAALSLIQGGTAIISQSTGAVLAVDQLNADAGSVRLTEANDVATLSGRANDNAGSGFVFSNDGGAALSVGTVDLIPGIRSGGGTPAPVSLSASGGSITQTQAITGSLLTVSAGGDITLTNTKNSFTAISATASPGNISLVNSNTGSASLTASASGTVTYKGFGQTAVQSVQSGSAATGSTFGAAAVSIESTAVTAGSGLNVDASSNGSVFVKSTNGGIGGSSVPLAIDTSGGVWLQSTGTSGNIYLSTPASTFKVGNLISGGSASITGPGVGTLDLRNASAATTLGWGSFSSATLGSGGGMVSAGGVINAGSNVFLAGILAPGGIGSISSMNVSGNFDVLSGATIFLTLFTKEADKQAQDGNHASDNLVDDSQCRR